jgi:type II secretion system protein N
MTRANLLGAAGYSSFFFLWFVLFAYWTFPYDRVTNYLADAVEKSGGGYSVEIGDLDPYWVTGVEVENVLLTKVGALPSAAAEEKKSEPSFRIRDARARLGIWPLLFGNRALNFDAELEQGQIEGKYEDRGESKRVDATLAKIDLSKVGLLASLIDLPFKGELGGNIGLELAAESAKTAGRAELTMRDLVIGDGKAKLKIGAMGGITIDPIEVGNVNIELDVKDGVGTVKKLSADGKDIELTGSGEIHLSEPLSRSRLDLLLRVKFTDAYRNKSDRTKAMFALLDGSAIPQVRSAKTPDGALQFKIVGAVATARALPSGRSRAAGATESKSGDTATKRRVGKGRAEGEIPALPTPVSLDEEADEE